MLFESQGLHAPPYTKAGRDHDSDTMSQSEQLRRNFLPLLEQHGVDLVLSGHNHVFERSFLVSGHYGTSTSFDTATMLKDGRSGRADSGEEYVHLEREPLAGTVYAFVGSSGGFPVLDGGRRHPAMYHSSLSAGSLVLEVDGDELKARFLGESPDAVEDWFTIRHRGLESRVDANRDGEIGFANAADRTTPDQPFHFWVNGDHDTRDDDADPALTLADGLDDVVVHPRDLEDFTRVRVRLPVNAPAGATLTVRMHAASGAQPAVNLWRAVEPGFDYLTDAAAAARQIRRGEVLTVETGAGEREIPPHGGGTREDARRSISSSRAGCAAAASCASRSTTGAGSSAATRSISRCGRSRRCTTTSAWATSSTLRWRRSPRRRSGSASRESPRPPTTCCSCTAGA